MVATHTPHASPGPSGGPSAWGYEGGDASLLKTHICHIRQKLTLPADGAGSIRSFATIGYSLVKQRSATGSSTMARPDGALQRTALCCRAGAPSSVEAGIALYAWGIFVGG